MPRMPGGVHWRDWEEDKNQNEHKRDVGKTAEKQTELCKHEIRTGCRLDLDNSEILSCKGCWEKTVGILTHGEH